MFKYQNTNRHCACSSLFSCLMWRLNTYIQKHTHSWTSPVWIWNAKCTRGSNLSQSTLWSTSDGLSCSTYPHSAWVKMSHISTEYFLSHFTSNSAHCFALISSGLFCTYSWENSYSPAMCFLFKPGLIQTLHVKRKSHPKMLTLLEKKKTAVGTVPHTPWTIPLFGSDCFYSSQLN